MARNNDAGKKSAPVQEHTQPKRTGTEPHTKRLVVCCDGTWNNSINSNNSLTNVSRLARCIENEGEGVPQVVYYHPGIGSGTSAWSNRVDGATGRGITYQIKMAYTFICLNSGSNVWAEIYLAGFSRGAYTVLCLASLIDKIGLLNKTNLVHLNSLVKTMAKMEQLRWPVRIEAMAIWDTVDALGIPMPWGSHRLDSGHVPGVGDKPLCNMNNVFHALALNERRKDYRPVLWSSPVADTNLNQCWFLGSHSDVGGGNEDIGLSNITLLWMAAQLRESTHLIISDERLKEVLMPRDLSDREAPNLRFQGKLGSASLVKSDGSTSDVFMDKCKSVTGEVTESFTGLFKLRGQYPRSLGFFNILRKLKPASNGHDSTNRDSVVVQKDEGTPQSVHWTVRVMMSKRKTECSLLEIFETKQATEDVPMRVQTQDPASPAAAYTVVEEYEYLPEDRVSSMEKNMFDQWLADTAGPRRADASCAQDDGTLTSFLRLWAREAEEPTVMFAPRNCPDRPWYAFWQSS